MANVHQLIGGYAVSASTPVPLPLKSLKPKHSVKFLQVRISALLTAATGGGNATLTNAQWDSVLATIVSRVRLYGGLMGEAINISIANLRSLIMLSTGVDIVSYQVSTGTAAL